MGYSSDLGFLVGLVVVGLAWLTIERTRSGKWSHRTLQGLAIASLGTLGVVLFSDWPGEWLNRFWADHSVLAGMLSTVLLVGAGLLGFEAREVNEQTKLAEAMGGTALGGMVGPLLNVDTALGMLTTPSSTWPRCWDATSKPLAWIRALPESEQEKLRTPTSSSFELQVDADDTSRLLDQCIRRTVGTARNWAALAAGSVEGRAVLASFGAVRNELVRLQHMTVGGDHHTLEVWSELRADVQQLLVALELASGSPAPRTLIDNLPTPDVAPDRAVVIRGMVARIGRPTERIGSVRHLLPDVR